MALRGSGFLMLLVLSGPAVAGEGVYQAPSPEPSSAETYLLRLINRCRADPPAEGERLAQLVEGQRRAVATWATNPASPKILHVDVSPSVDLAMFRAEMAQIRPAPPLVFDLRLIDAARKHAHYMILHELGHVEVVGQPGFTGVAYSDRLAAAGWTGGGSENCYRDAGTIPSSHSGFIIDPGPGGAGGMQPGRGHRTAICNPVFTKIGIGALPHTMRPPGSPRTLDLFSVVHNPGSDGRRYVGGVVFVDGDRDGDYTIGEGQTGAEVVAGDVRVAPWASGAYSLEIPATAGSLVIRLAGLERRCAIPAGTTNVVVEWAVPRAEDLAAIDKLVAAVATAKEPGSAAGRKARVALALASLGLTLDDDRAARVHSACDDLGTRILADRALVRAALDREAKALKEALAEPVKTWRGTAAADWFTEAEAMGRARQAVEALRTGSATPTAARALAKALKAQAAKTAAAEFRVALEGLSATAEALADAPPRR